MTSGKSIDGATRLFYTIADLISQVVGEVDKAEQRRLEISGAADTAEVAHIPSPQSRREVPFRDPLSHSII